MSLAQVQWTITRSGQINRKKSDGLIATHCRVQIRTFWIYVLYMVVSSLVVGVLVPHQALASQAYMIAGQLAWLPVVVWFVVRCVKGLRYLSRQEPYPNPGTWLW